MVTPEHIAGIYAAVKASKDISYSALKAWADRRSKDQEIDSQRQRLEVLSSWADDLSRLHEAQLEITQLRQQLARADEWGLTIGAFRCVKTLGDAWVLQHQEDQNKLACPSCVNKAELHILQPTAVGSHIHYCPGCKCCFPIRFPDELCIPKTVSYWS